MLHVVLVVVGAWMLLGMLRMASAEPPTEPAIRTPRIGSTEATVIAAAVLTLFALFAGSQVLVATGGADHVLRTQGLTYAEYARSGFFQLLWAAGLTIAGLLGLRALVGGSAPAVSRRITRLSFAIVALTLVIVAVAIRRMMLYQDAFGLTMLRLYVVVFAAWLGVVLLLVSALLLGLRRDRAWFPGVAAVSLLGILIGLNLANPEAVVARHNLTRPEGTRPVDEAYLADLSDDAVPTIVDLLPSLDPSTRARVLAAAVCTGDDERYTGWGAANLAKGRADDARAETRGPAG